MFRSFLIKPASGSCNMKCDYCFYRDEQDNRETKSYGRMDIETSHKLIDLALDSNDSCSFAFQGGEPTLAGLDFFKDFVSYASRKGRDRFSLAIQTNGFSIDRQWARFFHDNNFLVGLSMDGNKKIHDIYRHSKDGNGSFKNVFRTSEIFKSESVDFNILITVTKDVAKHIDQIHPFFVRNGFRYLQYIPCIDPISDSRGQRDYSLSVELYGEFLCKLFDYYYKAWTMGEYISIRYFDNLVLILSGQRPEACGMSGVCGLNYVVEADGSVFPCDFYVLDGYKLGNIKTNTFKEIDDERDRIGFVDESRKVAEECKVCKYFPLCRGGCKRDRDTFSEKGLSLNYLCPAFKHFFSYAIPALDQMARAEMRARGMNNK